MSELDRRRFVQLLGASAGAAVAASVLPSSIARAAAIPASGSTRTIADVEHVVILMQENRSFDHYYGTLNGIRGFGDPRPATQFNGRSVFAQDPSSGPSVLPFHPTAANLGLQFMSGLDHGWGSMHSAWNSGRWDRWVPAKGAGTMAHLTRADIPFHYALADAFTICDAYHCSLLGPTDPNRYYLFTGWVGNDGSGGGPVVDNAEAGYNWRTFPEVLQAAGISWRVYQDIGKGLNAAGEWGFSVSDMRTGNYGDNSLLYFTQYQNAQPGSPLYQNARTGTNVSAGGTLFDQLQSDVTNNTLPQVSWIAAPVAYCEHPSWPANYGAYYISQILNALTSNPAVWSRTVFLVTYDENDGFFDHVVPPYPPRNTNWGKSSISVANEWYAGSGYSSGPYGLGARVPMLALSPWSRGGYVCSQTFDHTSIVQFVEKRFGVHCPNISEWRRTVCGDLTSAFNFASPSTSTPSLPSTSGYQPTSPNALPSFSPTVPANPSMPVQESGYRPTRPLPYRLAASAAPVSGSLQLTFVNTGSAGATFQVRSTIRSDQPWTYTTAAGQTVTDTWLLPSSSSGAYQYSIFGPNGFLREIAGIVASLGLLVTAEDDPATGTVGLIFTNTTTTAVTFTAVNAYTQAPYPYTVAPGQSVSSPGWGSSAYGWYDITVTVDSDTTYVRRFAGHVETGSASWSDPRIITS